MPDTRPVMPDGRPLRCTSCRSAGPIYTIRHIAQTMDLTDDDGNATADLYDVQWEYANRISRRRGRTGILVCGRCGHTWSTTRELPF